MHSIRGRLWSLVALPLLAGAAPAAVEFAEVTEQAGIRFVHNNGAFGKKYLPETMGSGLALFDYDGDGDLDLLLVNGTKWPGQPGPAGKLALYRNDGGMKFTAVTDQAGLGAPIYGMGAAVADADGDGDTDLYITALGPNRFYRNQGDGRFVDASAETGLGDRGFGSSAAFLDYDHDGDLDLFVCNYVEWTAATDLWCSLDGKSKSYCTPESYTGQSPRLYRNDQGKFSDVSRAAGILNPKAKALGVALIDFDDDGWTDIAVANDTQPNSLYRNLGGGRFAEEGLVAGIAFAEDGAVRGAMGIDAADYDGIGRPSLAIGNFANEMIALYHNEGGGFFIDEAPRSEVGRKSLLTLSFGCFFFDADLDGRLDLFVANGHVDDDIHAVQREVHYAQPPHLFRNLGGGRFQEVTERAGARLKQPKVGRGAGYGDLDGDGDLDLVMTTNGGPAHLYENRSAPLGGWIGLRLVGTRSNRDAIGAKVRLKSSAGWQTQWVKSGSSYLSESQRALSFGLGTARPERVEVRWPSGRIETFSGLAKGQMHTLKEGAGKPAAAKSKSQP